MIFEFLDSNGIAYHRVDHPAVYTCEEARRLVPHLEGSATKNLFLRDGKGRRHFLLSVTPEKNVDLKGLSKQLNVSGLGFASPDRLKTYLNLEAGSVTLLGVINDSARAVEVLIDEDLWRADVLLCHPLVNTSTLAIGRADIERFLEATAHSPKIIVIPTRGDA